jgi:Fic family protein
MSLEGLFSDIDRLKTELEELPSITPENDHRLQKVIRLEFNYNSNHIEGNTLTYTDTELLLLKGDTRGNHNIRDYEEMKASNVALQLVKDFATQRNLLTETFLRQLNNILLVEPYYSNDAITEDGNPTQKKLYQVNTSHLKIQSDYKMEKFIIMLVRQRHRQ